MTIEIPNEKKLKKGAKVLRVTMSYPGQPVQVKRWMFLHLNQLTTLKGPGVNNHLLQKLKSVGHHTIEFDTGKVMKYEIENPNTEPLQTNMTTQQSFWNRLRGWFRK